MRNTAKERKFCIGASRAVRTAEFALSLLALSFVICGSQSAAQASTGTTQPPTSVTQSTASSSSCLPITPPGDFGDRDIGTTTAQMLVATNCSDATTNLSASISGSNVGDFSGNSTCLTNVPPKGHCTIVVVFTPATIGKDNHYNDEMALCIAMEAGHPVFDQNWNPAMSKECEHPSLQSSNWDDK